MNQPSQAQARATEYVPCFLGCSHPNHVRGEFLAYETQGGVQYEIRQCPGCKTRMTHPVKASHLVAGIA